MTKELFYLLLLAVFNGILWVPVAVAYVKTRGFLKPEDYVVAPTSPLPPWGNRAIRAHMNGVETFSPFAAVVIISALMNYSSQITIYCAAIFFYARIIHALVHISGFKHFMARTVIFNISWIAFLVYAIELLRQA